MIHTEVTPQAIDWNQIMGRGCPPAHGAQLIFQGLVRNHNQGKPVLGVSYDVHPVLAAAAFQEIAQEAVAKWGEDLSIQVIHRSGRLNVGECSLVLIVSSKHRDESYQASRYLIEQLKHRAPIWKKEHYRDGDSEWLEGHALCGHDHDDQHSEHGGLTI